MSVYREQALIEAPVETIWELIGDAKRHPEWWPRMIEVECEGLEEACTYKVIGKSPMGVVENEMLVETLDGCRELSIRCMNTGMYCKWLLTEARDGTFIDAEFGMEPTTAGTRVFDVLAGKRYFRRWVGQSLEGLRKAATRQPTAA